MEIEAEYPVKVTNPEETPVTGRWNYQSRLYVWGLVGFVGAIGRNRHSN